MKVPPPMIDGARVLFWADASGIAKSEACVFRRDGQDQLQFTGLAIAQYKPESGCYLFLCNADWETQNDTLHRNIDEARKFAESLFPGITARWRQAAE